MDPSIALTEEGPHRFRLLSDQTSRVLKGLALPWTHTFFSPPDDIQVVE